ncbi:MAG: TonB family protein [Gammaproteobacteria bacterium]
MPNKTLFPLGISMLLHVVAVLTYLYWPAATDKAMNEAVEQRIMIDLLQAAAEPVLVPVQKTASATVANHQKMSATPPAMRASAISSVSATSEAIPISRMPELVPDELAVKAPVALPQKEEAAAPAVAEVQHRPVAAAPSPPSEHGAALPEDPVVIAPQRPGMPDEDGLGAFKNTVIGHLERFRNYPRQAMDRGISGVVYVQFVIDADGHVERVDVVPPRESHPLLEQAAMNTIRRASPLPGVPERLKKAAQITLRFAMQYELH